MISFDDAVKYKKAIVSAKVDADTHVVYGADDNYMLGMCVSLFSVLKNNKDINVHFHLFSNVENDLAVEGILSLAAEYDFSCTFYAVDVDCLKGLPVKKRFPVSTYFRIVAADYLANEIEKFIYLDSDIICNGSLKGIIDHQFSNPIAAAPDIDIEYSKNIAIELGVPEIEGTYFNSGVMYMLSDGWKRLDVSNKMMMYLNGNNNSENLGFPDQDMINIIVKGRVDLLDPIYNVQYSVNDEIKNSAIEIPENVIFLHYIGGTKPWHDWGRYCTGSSLYLEFKKESPWKDLPLLFPDSHRHWKNALKHIRSRPRARFIIVYLYRYLRYRMAI